jgi:hypothetical protein
MGDTYLNRLYLNAVCYTAGPGAPALETGCDRGEIAVNTGRRRRAADGSRGGLRPHDGVPPSHARGAFVTVEWQVGQDATDASPAASTEQDIPKELVNWVSDHKVPSNFIPSKSENVEVANGKFHPSEWGPGDETYWRIGHYQGFGQLTYPQQKYLVNKMRPDWPGASEDDAVYVGLRLAMQSADALQENNHPHALALALAALRIATGDDKAGPNLGALRKMIGKLKGKDAARFRELLDENLRSSSLARAEFGSALSALGIS